MIYVAGGRVRVLANDDTPGEDYKVLTGNAAGTYQHAYQLSQLPPNIKAAVENLCRVYGIIYGHYIDGEVPAYIVAGVTMSKPDWVKISTISVFEKCGFVEGVARITTPVGDAACVVKNGTLYPIITEYDQATEDNWTLQDVYLNGDNEVSNLQQMVDRSGNYLAYTEDQEADKWSPIENYLHMHVKMPVVPKIGYVPAEQVGLGNVLPGLNYAVTL